MYSSIFGSLLVGAFSMSIASTSFGQVVVSGSGARGSVTQSLGIGAGAALLSSFDLNFGFGNDHHIKTVRVLPSEASSNVSTAYADKNSDDAFSWKIGFYGLSDSRIMLREATGRCRGRCVSPVAVPSGYTIVLRGFELKYVDSDHHIKTIGVESSGTGLTMYMADKNSDDLFDYRVRYALVPSTLLGQIDTSSGNSVGSAQAMISGTRTVLRGFMMHFSSSDHHISRIAVLPQNRNMSVSYHDKNADDSFSWRVQWATLR